MVRRQVVTSREVQIQNMLELVLYQKATRDKLRTLAVDSRAFGQATQDALLEVAIAMEAESFNLVQIKAAEVTAAQSRALRVLNSVADWKELEVSKQELEKGIKRKLQAKKFIEFRAQSSVLPVTDAEAQKYFTENRLKYGGLPFENFKDSIKSYLSRTQVERRLKDWYDLLLNKYQVKNLIAEL